MASRFWVGGTGTWDASDTSHWSATSGGASGASVPGSSDDVTLDGSSGGGTVTVNTNFTITSLTMGAFTGTLDFATNNNSPSIGSFSGTGTGTRTLNLGSGTFTLTNGTSATCWNFTTVTNLTFNAGTSRIKYAYTSNMNQLQNFHGGGLTYATVEIDENTNNPNGYDFIFPTTCTIGTLVLTKCNSIRVTAGITLTITNAFTFDGTSTAPVLFQHSSNSGTRPIVSVGGACTLNWALIRGITKAGAGSITATNSFDKGGNSGITITNPARFTGHPGMNGGLNA